jgi:hypothetical protein
VVAIEELLHLRRQLVQAIEDEVDLVLRQRPPRLGEPERKQAEQRDLRGLNVDQPRNLAKTVTVE